MTKLLRPSNANINIQHQSKQGVIVTKLLRPSNANINIQHQSNFRAIIPYLQDLELFVTAFSLPDMSVNEVATPYQGAEVWMPDNQIIFSPLTLDFLVDEEMNNYFQIREWMERCALIGADNGLRTPFTSQNKRFDVFSDVDVVILDNAQVPLYSIIFRDCFPTNLGTVAYDSQVDQPMPQRSSLTLRFTYFERSNNVSRYLLE